MIEKLKTTTEYAEINKTMCKKELLAYIKGIEEISGKSDKTEQKR